MDFCFVFGLILLMISLVANMFMQKSINTDLPTCTYKEQEKDIKMNKRFFIILLILGSLLTLIGIIGFIV